VSHSDGSGVKSAERALSILELFSRPQVGLTFTQVAEKLGYPRSSLHGLLRTMETRGWLRLDPATRRFSLGLRAWEAGAAYTPAVELARRAAPVLQRLETSVDAAVNLAVLDGADAVSIVNSAGWAGGRAAATATGAGRVMLAELDRDGRERRLGTLAGVDELHATLDQVRTQGWGDHDEERPEGVRSLAVPVRDRSGEVVAALEVSAPLQRLEPERRDETLRALRQGAEQISAGLAFSAPG
jgi:DNA-binding IclR family transcriptional regulator